MTSALPPVTTAEPERLGYESATAPIKFFSSEVYGDHVHYPNFSACISMIEGRETSAVSVDPSPGERARP